MFGLAVAQEAEQVLCWLGGRWFDPQSAVYESVHLDNFQILNLINSKTGEWCLPNSYWDLLLTGGSNHSDPTYDTIAELPRTGNTTGNTWAATQFNDQHLILHKLMVNTPNLHRCVCYTQPTQTDDVYDPQVLHSPSTTRMSYWRNPKHPEAGRTGVASPECPAVRNNLPQHRCSWEHVTCICRDYSELLWNCSWWNRPRRLLLVCLSLNTYAKKLK